MEVNMKRMACLLITVLSSAISIYAGDTGKATTMTGWLCNSQCVTQTSGHAACDQSCANKTGEVVFIDDQDRVLKIANQDKVKLHASKKVKMKCRPVEGSKDTMYVDGRFPEPEDE